MFIINVLLTQIHLLKEKYIILVHNINSMLNLDKVKYYIILKECQWLNKIYTKSKSKHVTTRAAPEVEVMRLSHKFITLVTLNLFSLHNLYLVLFLFSWSVFWASDIFNDDENMNCSTIVVVNNSCTSDGLALPYDTLQMFISDSCWFKFWYHYGIGLIYIILSIINMELCQLIMDDRIRRVGQSCFNMTLY